MKSSGFTLVEIAVVMVIIGVLIGGILKGTEMVRHMKVVETIGDIENIEKATLAFTEKYGAYPGDIAAQGRIRGCPVGGTNCLNGNENAVVGGTRGVDDTNWLSDVRGKSETVQFWKHLALEGLINKVNAGATTSIADFSWGDSHPAAPIGGGYDIYYDAWTTIDFDGHILRISLDSVSPGQPNGVLSPAQAAEIDRKLDNGNPGTGDIVADYGVNDNACKTFDVYDEGTNNTTCRLYFLLID